jgi:hypothetical protein
MWFSKRSTPVVPAPFSVPTTGVFDGNDGSWSTFEIRVGNPSLKFRVIPSFLSSSTWVPTTQGCQTTNTGTFIPSNCSQWRGLDPGNPGYNYKDSVGANGYDVSYLDLGPQTNLVDLFGPEYNISAGLVTDTVSMISPSETLSYNKTPIYAFVKWDFFLGSLGLGFANFSFENTHNHPPSLLGMLADEVSIPSQSWAYTAGASYRKFHHIFCQLQ